MRMTQPDGTEITVRLYGDESGHYYLSDDGYPLRRDDDGFFYYRTGFSGSTASVRAHDKSARTPDEQAFLATIDKKSAVNHTVLRTAATRRNSPACRPVACMPIASIAMIFAVCFIDGYLTACLNMCPSIDMA